MKRLPRPSFGVRNAPAWPRVSSSAACPAIFASANASSVSFGAPIAHGYLTLSLFIPLFTELLDVEGVSTKVNYGLNKVRFPSPVKVGSKIRLVGKLASVEDVPGGVQITVDGTIEIEGAPKPAAVLQSLSRFYA